MIGINLILLSRQDVDTIEEWGKRAPSLLTPDMRIELVNIGSSQGCNLHIELIRGTKSKTNHPTVAYQPRWGHHHPHDQGRTGRH